MVHFWIFGIPASGTRTSGCRRGTKPCSTGTPCTCPACQITGPVAGLVHGVGEAGRGAGGLPAVHALLLDEDVALAGRETVDHGPLLSRWSSARRQSAPSFSTSGTGSPCAYRAGALAGAAADAAGGVDEDADELLGVAVLLGGGAAGHQHRARGGADLQEGASIHGRLTCSPPRRPAGLRWFRALMAEPALLAGVGTGATVVTAPATAVDRDLDGRHLQVEPGDTIGVAVGALAFDRRRGAPGMTGLAVDPEAVEIIGVRHREVRCHRFMVAGDALGAILFRVPLMSEDDLAGRGHPANGLRNLYRRRHRGGRDQERAERQCEELAPSHTWTVWRVTSGCGAGDRKQWLKARQATRRSTSAGRGSVVWTVGSAASSSARRPV